MAGINGRTRLCADGDAIVDVDAAGAVRRAVIDLTGSPEGATIGEGLVAAHRLRTAADELVTELVVAARASGATWADIADVLGVSTQAAHQKYRFIAASE